jgi:O-antigen ligase
VWLAGFVSVIMMSRSIDSPLRLDTVMFAGSIGGGIAGGIGVVQMVLFHYGELIWAPLKTMFNPFWHQLDNLVAKLAINYLLPDFAKQYIQRTEFISIEERASSTFTNPVMFAAFLTMMLPLAVYCMFYLNGKGKKLVSFGCAVLIVGGIAASYSRGPYLALAAAFIVLLFYGGKRTLALLGIGVGGIAAVAVVADGVFKRLLTLFNGNDISVNTRSDIWRACFDMLKGHWVFGYGTGVNNVREQLHGTYNINQPHAHNIFIQTTLENGVIGTALLLGSFIAFGIMLLRLCRKGKK